MKYTKEQLQDAVEALAQAKTHLADDARSSKENFICLALQNTKHQGSETAREIVMYAISPYFTFSNWIEDKNGNIRRTRMQQLRHQWIDQLISDINSQIEAAK